MRNSDNTQGQNEYKDVELTEDLRRGTVELLSQVKNQPPEIIERAKELVSRMHLEAQGES